MTVADDLATLRQSVRFSNAQPRLSVSWECNAALDRVEAEIARLERALGNIQADYDDVFGQLLRRHGDVHRAEAEVERLRAELERRAGV